MNDQCKGIMVSFISPDLKIMFWQGGSSHWHGPLGQSRKSIFLMYLLHNTGLLFDILFIETRRLHCRETYSENLGLPCTPLPKPESTVNISHLVRLIGRKSWFTLETYEDQAQTRRFVTALTALDSLGFASKRSPQGALDWNVEGRRSFDLWNKDKVERVGPLPASYPGGLWVDSDRCEKHLEAHQSKV